MKASSTSMYLRGRIVRTSAQSSAFVIGISMLVGSCVVPGADSSVPDWGVRTQCEFVDSLASDIELTTKEFTSPDVGDYTDITCPPENSRGAQVVVRVVGSNELQSTVDTEARNQTLVCGDRVEILVPVLMNRGTPSLASSLADAIAMSGSVCQLL